MTGPYLIAGNWKMNGLNSSLAVLEETARSRERLSEEVDVVVLPPATLLAVSSLLLKDTRLQLGGQDCSSEDSGAFTGEISASMLKDAGAKFVILGHSERRQRHAESDDLVRRKVQRENCDRGASKESTDLPPNVARECCSPNHQPQPTLLDSGSQAQESIDLDKAIEIFLLISGFARGVMFGCWTRAK